MSEIWIGTYPKAGLGTPVGTGEGLWRARLSDDGVLTAVQVSTQAAPSFVVRHPNLPLVYTIEESPASVMRVISTADATQLARVAVGVESGCHLLLSADARTLYVSAYGSGELAVILLDAAGLPLDEAPQQLWRHEGTGPNEERQEGPHAHFAGFSPDGAYVLVCDLGTDEIRRYRIGAEGLLGDAAIASTLPPGAGPRHFAVRGDVLYVVCELDHQLRTLRWDREVGEATLIAEAPLTLAPHRTGMRMYGAHVEVVERPIGDVLLVSVRGADVLSVFDIAPEGELTYRCALDVGEWPRHFAVVGDHLVVGAERGHEVRAYSLDAVLSLPPEPEVGALAALASASAPVVSPACICP